MTVAQLMAILATLPADMLVARASEDYGIDAIKRFRIVDAIVEDRVMPPCGNHDGYAYKRMEQYCEYSDDHAVKTPVKVLELV